MEIAILNQDLNLVCCNELSPLKKVEKPLRNNLSKNITETNLQLTTTENLVRQHSSSDSIVAMDHVFAEMAEKIITRILFEDKFG